MSRTRGTTPSASHITVMRDIIDFQDQVLGSYPDDNVDDLLPGTERPV